MTPGDLIKDARLRQGLSQRRLAHRAGTSQSAIARIEAGTEEVTWPRLKSILLAMGEEPVLDTKAVPARYDAWDLLEQRRQLRFPLERPLQNELRKRGHGTYSGWIRAT